MLTVILSVFSEQINAGKTSEPDTTPHWLRACTPERTKLQICRSRELWRKPAGGPDRLRRCGTGVRLCGNL